MRKGHSPLGKNSTTVHKQVAGPQQVLLELSTTTWQNPLLGFTIYLAAGKSGVPILWFLCLLDTGRILLPTIPTLHSLRFLSLFPPVFTSTILLLLKIYVADRWLKSEQILDLEIEPKKGTFHWACQSYSHGQPKSAFLITHEQEFFATNLLQIWTQHPQKPLEMGAFQNFS